MRSEILDQATRLALDAPALAMPLLLGEGLSPSKSAAYGRVAVELQLEERETRQKVVKLARYLGQLLKLAQSRGLLKKNECADEGWLNRVPHQSRYAPDPILGTVSVLNEHIETIERKLLVWESYLRNPRCSPRRREIVRSALMALSPGAYEARFRLRGIEPYKPLEPCSGSDYRTQVDDPQSFNLNKVARVNHAFRLERASERALARVKPQELTAYTERWWKMRYDKRISDEPSSARKERLSALMSKYGVGLAEMKPLNLEGESSRDYEPFEFSRSVTMEQGEPRAFDPQEFEELEAPSARMGWQELDSEGSMQLTSVKSWIADERSVSLPGRYSPTIEVGDPEIQTAIELLAALTPFLRSFSGFEEIRDIGRAGGARHHQIREEVSDLPSSLHNVPASHERRNSEVRPDPTSLSSDRPALSARSTELNVVTQPDGGYVLRLAGHMSPAVRLDRARPSVLEIELRRDPDSEGSSVEYSAELLRVYEAQESQIADDPLRSEFVRELLLSGRVTRIENLRFQPSREVGTSFLKLDLAEGAVLRDVHFDGPSTLLRIRGDLARFENVHLSDLSVDLMLSRTSWSNCHVSSNTKMRGSLGESSFDSACVVPWDASELDMRLADFDPSNLQSRLSGLVANYDMLPASIRRELSLTKLSPAEMETIVRLRRGALSRKDVVSMLMRLDGRVSFYRGNPTINGETTESLLAIRRSRDRISLPSGSALHTLCILFGDSAKRLPPRIILDTYVQAGSQGTRLSTDLGNMSVSPLDDEAVLSRALDFFYDGALCLPKAARASDRSRSALASELVRVD